MKTQKVAREGHPIVKLLHQNQRTASKRAKQETGKTGDVLTALKCERKYVNLSIFNHIISPAENPKSNPSVVIF